jgi:hypothetical protein
MRWASGSKKDLNSEGHQHTISRTLFQNPLTPTDRPAGSGVNKVLFEETLKSGMLPPSLLPLKNCILLGHSCMSGLGKGPWCTMAPKVQGQKTINSGNSGPAEHQLERAVSLLRRHVTQALEVSPVPVLFNRKNEGPGRTLLRDPADGKHSFLNTPLSLDSFNAHDRTIGTHAYARV